MAPDVSKLLDRARKHLERNRIQEAIDDYASVLETSPSHPEALQALGDLYARHGDSAQAAHFYGELFDCLAEADDAAKAAALYGRFLKSVPQPPERVARYALLLQRQHKLEEAIECYQNAAEQFLGKRKPAEALACWERMVQLDPDNPGRHIRLGEIAEQAGRHDLAARGYLRAGQLALAGNELDLALELFERAHKQAPNDRSVALVFATARLRKGDAAGAVSLLEPFPANEADQDFLAVYGECLLRVGKLDRAREVLEVLYRDKGDDSPLLFELVSLYLKAGKGEKAVQVLTGLKKRMLAAGSHNSFTAALDKLAEVHPKSLPLAHFWSQLYDELNRETKYFEAMVRVFDLYLEAGKNKEACEALERLVDIDPYDYRIHDRVEKLEGRIDAAYLKGIRGRVAKTSALTGQSTGMGRRGEVESLQPATEEGRAQQTLEDLIVQAEIFLQYSLRDKVMDRLQKIAQLFPGEEERNERLRVLQEMAGWQPAGQKRPAEPAPVPPATPAPGKSGIYSPETLRDLAKISEITKIVYRQSTPREVLAAAVQEIGKFLGTTRCLAAIGAPGGRPQMAAEFCAPGTEPASGSAVGRLLTQLVQAPVTSLGTVELHGDAAPVLRELGLEAVLAVPLADKDTQTQAAVLVAGDPAPRKWKPNESYFLQAVGDQMLLCVNHAKLRSLVRTLAVADEKTGLLGRGSYLDCLLTETGRARTQNTPLSLLILQVDRGPETLRQQGEEQFDRYMEQLAKALETVVRQNDLAVKYNAWSLALILPDTGLENARVMAEKLRQVAAGVQPPWSSPALTLSAAVVQAVGRNDFDSEDIVTDLVNRAEFSLDEARKQGGGALVSSPTPQV